MQCCVPVKSSNCSNLTPPVDKAYRHEEGGTLTTAAQALPAGSRDPVLTEYRTMWSKLLTLHGPGQISQHRAGATQLARRAKTLAQTINRPDRASPHRPHTRPPVYDHFEATFPMLNTCPIPQGVLATQPAWQPPVFGASTPEVPPPSSRSTTGHYY